MREHQKLIQVKDAVLLADQDDDLATIPPPQLALPARDALATQQAMGQDVRLFSAFLRLRLDIDLGRDSAGEMSRRWVGRYWGIRDDTAVCRR
jgi:hypothetical protein